jgi:UDP-2-acetamido-3-amino-2,3-dideoxy-glucuronate N-acetyltransferase
MDNVFVHPHALAESETIGSGTRIWAFAHVMKGAQIGAKCNICDHAFVESGAVLGNGVTIKNGVSVWNGVTLEDEVFLGPNVALTNDMIPRSHQLEEGPSNFELVPTRICHGASVGANATIVCGVTIGEYAMVGAGAVVTRDVPAYTLVAGVPARPMGLVCRCGCRMADADISECGTCGRRYVRDDSGWSVQGETGHRDV